MIWKVARAALLIALAGFYVAGAMAHATRVNTFKARGDQSGYLGDAENVYANWHGKEPPVLIGERNRMPVYAGFQALAYNPALSDAEFFEVGKKWNIYLSLVLLAGIGVILWRWLPDPAATNLLLIAAFGYFVFKAGYVQSELLFYFFFFAAFVLLFQILVRRPGAGGWIWRAGAAGGLNAMAYLTKAATLPLMAIFLVVCVAEALVLVRRDQGESLRKLLAAALVAATFLAVLSPYVLTNKKVFGQYFYNVNTTFYVWYDDWPQASIGTIKHGDGVGWPVMPAEELPGASRYWREHTVGQIADRIAGGFLDMAERSYETYWYLNYVSLYMVFAAVLLAKRRREFGALVRAYPAVFAFLMTYALVYLLGIAFYAPVSGTGTTRFLLVHILPLLFVLSLLFSLEPFRSTEWRLAGWIVRTQHFHLFISALLAFDLMFVIWPRLMTTYGGF